MKRAGIQGNVYNDVGWGGWVLYELPPGTRTLYDSRIAFTKEAADLLLEDEGVVARRMKGLRSPRASERRKAEIQFGTERESLAERAAELGADILLRKGPVFGTDGVATPPANWELVYRGSDAEIWLYRDGKLEERLGNIHSAWGNPSGGAESDGLR